MDVPGRQPESRSQHCTWECTEVGCLAVDDGGHAALKKEVCLRRRHMLLVVS